MQAQLTVLDKILLSAAGSGRAEKPAIVIRQIGQNSNSRRPI